MELLKRQSRWRRCNTSEGKAKIIGKTPLRPSQLENPEEADWPAQLLVPSLNVRFTTLLKYLCNFWRSLDLTLMNCDVELYLHWKKDCLSVEDWNNITGINLMITGTKVYVPVVKDSKEQYLGTNKHLK